MDEDEKWTNVVTYVLKKCIYPNLIHVMRNGNWLIADKGEGYFYKVDLEKHTKDKLCSCWEGRIFCIHMGKYIETFVSPNR